MALYQDANSDSGDGPDTCANGHLQEPLLERELAAKATSATVEHVCHGCSVVLCVGSVGCSEEKCAGCWAVSEKVDDRRSFV